MRMVAAQWLVDGYEAPLLRELSSLTSRQALDGEVRLTDVLAELGHPSRDIMDSPYEQQLPWRGPWVDAGEPDEANKPSAYRHKVVWLARTVRCAQPSTSVTSSAPQRRYPSAS